MLHKFFIINSPFRNLCFKKFLILNFRHDFCRKNYNFISQILNNMINRFMHKMLTLCLLAVMIPAVTGFAFIYHYCFDCDSEKKDAVIVLLSHSHDESDCFCSEMQENRTSCCDTTTCSSERQPQELHNQHCEPHNHLCEIDFKKLEYNSTKCQQERLLPISAEINIFVGLLPDFISDISNDIGTKISKKFLFPPPFLDTNINILNCIFRL